MGNYRRNKALLHIALLSRNVQKRLSPAVLRKLCSRVPAAPLPSAIPCLYCHPKLICFVPSNIVQRFP